MVRTILVLAFYLLLLPRGHGQSTNPPVPPSEPANIPGLKLGKVPEVLYAQVPKLPAGQGILVVNVAPGSPAARAGLLRHDVLLSLGGKSLRDGGQFFRMLDTSSQKTALVVFRAGKEMTLRLPVIAVVPAAETVGAMAVLKPGGPPAVSVEAKPLQGNKLSVTFTYYANGSSKLERVTCSGSLEEIQKKVKDLGQQKRMPPRVQDLADLALERIQFLNSSSKKAP